MIASYVSSKIVARVAMVSILASTFSFAAKAQTKSDFDQAAPGYDQLQSPTLMTESEIQKAVLENMKRQCDSQGRCWLMGTDGSGSNWTIGFSAGVGSRNIGTGTTVINLGDEAGSNANDPYYGITISYRRYNCETNLRVAPAMKRLLETYQYAGVNADGTVKRTFSPADLALLSLYATLNAKLETCKQNGN